MKKQNITLGVIIGNRDFFPDKLVSEARVEILKVLEEQGIKTVLLGENDSKLGGVETYQDSRKCADLFIKHKDEISGVLVVLPNFGDERGVADTLHLANLKVPVLIQGYPDELNKLNVANRRDSWCGKISVCNNLYQYGIKYTITTKHVVLPSDLSFVKDLDQFSAVCRV
jgi:L-fucose isomerase-like protein